MNWQIRRPTLSDVPQIHEVFSKTIKNSFKEEGIIDPSGKETDEEIARLINTFQDDFATQGQKEYFLIAHLQNKIVGTIGYGTINPLISDNITIARAGIPELKSVYILPEFQNRGIGSLLFQHMLLVLAEKHIEEYYLDSGYKKSQQFWERKLGAPAHTLNDFWGKGNHHMIWHCLVGD